MPSLNPLGLGVHQSFTGCHWSPLPLLHDDITELVDVKDLVLLHLPFENALQMLNRVASPSPFPLASLARQWSSWRCVWGLYHVGILPCGPVSVGRGSCSALDMLTFMVPSINCSSSVPAALMQPRTMTLPPPYLTVGKTHLSLYSLPGCRHTCLTPSELNTFILVSSDHRTWFQ